MFGDLEDFNALAQPRQQPLQLLHIYHSVSFPGKYTEIQSQKLWWLKFQPAAAAAAPAASVRTERINNQAEMLIWAFPIVFLGSYFISLPGAESSHLLFWSLFWRSGTVQKGVWWVVSSKELLIRLWLSPLWPAFVSHLSCWGLGLFFYT